MKQSTHNLRIVFARRNGSIYGFVVTGHAGYGVEGDDIVCSAVSSAAQLVCNTVTDFFHADADVAVGENRIEIRLNSSDDPSVKLLDAFRDHMEYISEKYPGVKVELREA